MIGREVDARALIANSLGPANFHQPATTRHNGIQLVVVEGGKLVQCAAAMLQTSHSHTNE